MKRYLFGVDIGGTTVKLGLFENNGNLLEKWEIPTVTENNGLAILPDVAETIKNKLSEKNIAFEDVIGIGLGVPGPVGTSAPFTSVSKCGRQKPFEFISFFLKSSSFSQR